MGTTNPITQRPVGASTPNGVRKQSVQKATQRDAAPDKQAADRMTFLFANFKVRSPSSSQLG
jgi:hypothetical protein